MWTAGNALTTTPCNYRRGSPIHIRKYETEEPVSLWSEWSQCSETTCMKRRDRTCEVGIRLLKLETDELQGLEMTDCSSPLEEFTECSTEEVCTWSSWSSWSACGAVSGSALRQRPMVNMCSKSAHPLGKHRCTGHDEEKADCVELCGVPQWSEWEEGKNQLAARATFKS